MSKETTPRSKNNISRQDTFKVASWIEANYDKMKDWTREETSIKLAEHLGKAVTIHNFLGILKDMGKEFPGKQTGRQSPTGKFDRPRFLARQMLLLNKRVEALGREMGFHFPGLEMLNTSQLDIVAHSLSDSAKPVQP